MRRFFVILFSFITIQSSCQNAINADLFGFRTSLAFVFFSVEDTNFMEKVYEISPNVLSFPGGFGNFYHLDGSGYGLNPSEIERYHKKSRLKTAITINKLIASKGDTANYIFDFIRMAKLTNSRVIYNANIISSTVSEVLEVIKILIDNDLELIGIELGGELSNLSYSHFMTIDKYINLSKKYTDAIKNTYPEIPIAVVAAPNNRGSRILENWNNKLAQEDFYDAIVIHPYAKVVKGKDVAGRMLTVIPEGVEGEELYRIYKDRAIKYIISDFKNEIIKYIATYNDKRIWLTEWNLQMSGKTGNSLLQALFVAHQIIELSSLTKSNIDIATFHNLAGRTISGSMIMKKNKELKLNASFNSMKIVSRLFDQSLSFEHKKNISDDCFEYYYHNNREKKQFHYWINWSSEPIKLLSRFTGLKTEYYGANLFDKMLPETPFEYNESFVENQEIILMPFSVNALESLSN
tara:strand:- start:17088 stop:18479 length:1392 start_codon:yes stop_codon:yes gene_type:complete